MNLTSVTFDPFAAPTLLKSTASTESQRELWTASKFGADASAAFNEAISLRLKGSLDQSALQTAFLSLVSAHEALHTSFGSDGTSLLVEEPSGEIVLDDLSGLFESDRRTRIQAALRSQVTKPFDLSRAPLCRVRLLKIATDDHLLLISAHHIVCDGWSMSVLVNDFAELYSQALSGSKPARLARPRFSEYADSERQRSSGDEHRRAERYWLESFGGDSPIVDLPSDRPRPPLKTYASDRVDHGLDASLVARLKELGAKRNASFFVTLLAAFNGFVHRLAGVEDLVVGIPAAGQSFTDQPTLVGHCVNMLPLRTRLGSEQPFTKLLANVRRGLLDAYEHQQLTFGSLLQKLALRRDPSRLPLITLAFNVDQALAGDSLHFSGLSAEIATTPRAFENFDLFVNAAEKQGSLTLETQYNTDLFDRTTIERWLRGFEVLLRAAIETPDAPIGELEILTASEQAEFLRWNVASKREWPSPSTVPELLQQHWKHAPAGAALEAEDGSFGYADIEGRSLALATSLRARGIGRGSLVGISLERSSRLVVAVLGVLRSGAAYVPLDPGFPKDRLTFMAEDSGVALLVSERALEHELPAPGVSRLFLDDEQPLSSPLDANPERDARPEDPAYVIYTSGSTGKPKGVAVPHRAVVNFLRSMAEQPGLCGTDRLLAVTTLSFDISVLELLLPLTVGATIVLATSPQTTDGGALRKLLRDQRVNVLQATPATWRLLLGAGEVFGPGFRALCGGEALPKALADELLATGIELWNMYGPTETTVWSACQRILPGDARIRVGRPIANTQFHIVDARLRDVPIGVTGELCIAGAGVTLGYLHRPELTQERFIVNSAGTDRMYRTGDLARFLPDGTVECLGRSDGQVKLRGYRIELGEIETVLGRHAGVRQSVVLVREERPGDQRLIAYIVPREHMPEADALRAHLKQLVPDYMVPQHFVEMAALPLTPNGKVDRKKLPAPVSIAAAGGVDYVAPETDNERMLLKIWQKVLGIERISATDDFFQLGGHSLLAAQAMAQVAHQMQIEVSMRRIFEAPTLRALARSLDERRDSSTQSDSIPRREPNLRAPLSPMQQRLWFMEEMNPGTPVYNLPSCFRLRGKLNLEAFRRALNTVAERHTTLRTALGWRDNELCQIVQPTLTFDLTPVDLRGLGPFEREEKLLRLLKEAAAEPFNVTTGPLVRASLYLLGPDESALFFMPHHAIWDGWSFDVFLDEIDRLYAAFARDEASPLTPLGITYGDYAAWHRTWLTGPELERQTGFWLDQLSGELPVLDLPADVARPPSMDFAGATEAFELSGDLVTQLSELGRRCGATLYMVLLAAFDVLLFRLTGQSDIVVGTPVRGRNRPEVEPLIGYFVNALALRMRLDGDENFNDLLGRVREACIQAFGHQDMPFEVLVRKLSLQRDNSRTPVYSAFFTFQDVRNRKASIGDLSYEQIHVHPPSSPTDLSLWAKQVDSGLVGGLDYATSLFRRDTVLRWLGEFLELLNSIVANAQCPVARVPLLPLEERQALAAISETAQLYPTHLWLHQLFEAQVDRTPAAPAVTCGAERVAYAELDARANRLARALREAGAAAGQRVGICVERSVELLVATLAVQKCGAAYVPLDPAFPQARLHFMAEDSGLSVIVVDESTRQEAPRVPMAHVIDVDQDRARIATLDGSRLPPLQGSPGESPAYVIYTSGSTGKPKGVVVPHRALVNFATSMARVPGIRAEDRLLAVTTLSFDIAVLELYVPLTVGAEVVIATRELAGDGGRLNKAIDEYGITVMQATPTTWRLLLGAGFRGRPGFKVLCGGEAFPRDLAEQLLDVAGEVWNMYGPTETTVWSTCCRLERPLAEISIGRPIANTSVHVVDARGGLSPWGSRGELWIGGDGVALGYHGRPELSLERFVGNPFRPGRAYRTGDLVRLNRRGELEYIGRNDHQVKLRGYRIECGEIEARLAEHSAVEEACAMVRQDAGGGEARLVAYYKVRPGHTATATDLRKTLRRSLPDYMLPQTLLELEALPRTANGKIDRNALPAPFGEARSVAAATPPRSVNERLVADVWCDLLGRREMSVHDNFFEIGGHSLLVLQAISRIEHLTGVRLGPRAFVVDTLEQLSAQLPDPSGPPPSDRAPNRASGEGRGLFERVKRRILG